ncbi:MAG: nucleotide exchange factor GrpE [Synechococcales cyanobacterium RM1_1_8]|nr:nucleotide exchange factor GrpE [Synechococcales cyanobacterium RM1_1_8]
MAGSASGSRLDSAASVGAGAITVLLRDRMAARSLPSFRALAQTAGISEAQVLKLRRGQAAQMRLATLQKLAAALEISLVELLKLGQVEALTAGPGLVDVDSKFDSPSPRELALGGECDRLQQQLTHQEQTLRQQFQQDSLYILETWMKNWPRVVHAVEGDRPDLLAAKVLPLVKPLEQLLAAWGVVAIGCVGKSLAYDPQWHQLIQGSAQAGEAVTVTRPGYRQGDRLLHRAEVKA